MLASKPPPSADDPEQTVEKAAAKKPPQNCRVCDMHISKYKCPACLLPYCSLACFALHKSTHAKEDDAAPFKPVTTPPAPTDSTESVQQHKARPQTQQEALLSSPDLESLLRENPKLRAQLRAIYQVTLEPPAADDDNDDDQHHDRHHQRHRNRRSRHHDGPWTEEKGIKRGVETLRNARHRGGEGLEAFLTLLETISAQHHH